MPKQYPSKPQRDGAAPTGGKARWTEADRRKRAERPARGEQSARDDRPARPAGDRPYRPATGDRPYRPAAGDRPYRPARGEHAARPAKGERPDWSPRPPRDNAARPARDGGARGAGRDWSPREDRPRTDDRAPRREWNDRPARSHDDRPARPYQDRPARPAQDRPAAGDRPYRGTDRPYRPANDERPARPARGERPDWSPRPEREARALRRDWEDRQPRTERPRYDDRAARDDRAPRPVVEDVALERLQASAIAADAADGMTFADLGLGDNIVRQLAAMGASEPFPIQAATIPEVLAGRDVLGRGRTGSGKTIAFGAPIVERLLRLHRDAKPGAGSGRGRSMGRAPRALILAPTRELAQQIDRAVQPIARSVGLFTIAIVGGVPYHKQVTGLSRGVDIVIGTPGRIEDLVEQGQLDLSGIVVSVLDEADHMCDLGFLEPVQRIFRLTPEGSQRLLFSATLDTAVESLVTEFLRDPSVHEVAGEDQASSTIRHRVLMIDASAKRDVVRDLVESSDRSIVFTRTRAFAEDVAEGLMISGIPASSLHGDLNQARRNRNLQLLSRGDVRSLVATDVAARGIHVDDVDLVIQADMPDDHKTYLHRAGRTGRAGAHGTVVTVISPSRRRRLEELLKLAGIEAEWEDRASPRPPRGERTFREDRPYRPRASRVE